MQDLRANGLAWSRACVSWLVGGSGRAWHAASPGSMRPSVLPGSTSKQRAARTDQGRAGPVPLGRQRHRTVWQLQWRLACGLDRAEQAVCFVVDAGGEQQRGAVAGDAVAEAQRPQALDLDRAAVLVPQPSEERAGLRVVGVDAAVAEVADQQRAAEATEPRRGQRQAPGGVQLAPLDQV